MFHHALIYLKDGQRVHRFDFGPANGADVTANIMEAAPGRTVLTMDLTLQQVQAGGSEPSAPLPYLHCGPASHCVNSHIVQEVWNMRGEQCKREGGRQGVLLLALYPVFRVGPVHTQAIKFIEAGPYHALWRNCIHVADLLLRALTNGALRSGPLLYDLLAGKAPQV